MAIPALGRSHRADICPLSGGLGNHKQNVRFGRNTVATATMVRSERCKFIQIVAAKTEVRLSSIVRQFSSLANGFVVALS